MMNATTITSDSDLPGGAIIKRPDNAIEFGQSIFNSGDTGVVALSNIIPIFKNLSAMSKRDYFMFFLLLLTK